MESAGTTNDAGDDASGSDTMCVTCAEDYFVSNNTCVACAAGTTNAAGDDYSGSDTTCVTCAGIVHLRYEINDKQQKQPQKRTSKQSRSYSTK